MKPEFLELFEDEECPTTTYEIGALTLLLERADPRRCPTERPDGTSRAGDLRTARS